MRTLETERLILRPWTEEDAQALYDYARDPRVGPMAGWPVHTSVEESRRILRDVLMPADNAAVTLKTTGEVVGCIGLKEPEKEERSAPGDKEIGYWVGAPHWGHGYMPEAVRELIRFCFEVLGCQNVWCGHYEGNEKSKRVIEKCGFRFVSKCTTRVSLMNEERVEYFYSISRDDWKK